MGRGHGLKVKEVRKVLNYRAGYQVRTELIDGSEYEGPDVEMRSAYNTQGDYVGDPATARRLAGMGIVPELRDPKTSRTCSIGFCEWEQKWYGWSHRAIAGFGVGDKIFVSRFPNGDRVKPHLHGHRTIENMRDAKLAARRFAADVS
jgi:hypothetical protein